MIARVASFEGVNVAEAKRTMDEAESLVRPMIEGLAGFTAYLDLVAADGRMLSITIFDTEANAQAAEPTFDEEMPRKLGHLFETWEGRRVSVEHYDVLADTRS